LITQWFASSCQKWRYGNVTQVGAVLTLIHQIPANLNLSKLCADSVGPENSRSYLVRSVVLHSGQTIMSGHYVCHVLDHKSGSWLRYNDQSSSKLTQAQALFDRFPAENCYMLCLEREGIDN
jgi:hypothetical protein